MTEPQDVVERFYMAVGGGDSEGVADIVGKYFAEHASVTWPASLPYGGTVTGRDVLQKVLSSAARGGAFGPSGIEVAAIAQGRRDVAVMLTFSWAAGADAPAVHTGAMEWWSFDENGSVTAIDAYYRDTAALV